MGMILTHIDVGCYVLAHTRAHLLKCADWGYDGKISRAESRTETLLTESEALATTWLI